MPAALRQFLVAILIQIGVERNERGIEGIALDPDLRRTRLGYRDSYFIDASGVPFQRQLSGLAGFDPMRPSVISTTMVQHHVKKPIGEFSLTLASMSAIFYLSVN